MPSLRRLCSSLVISLAAGGFLSGCQSLDPRLSDRTVYLGGHKDPQEMRDNADNYSYWAGDSVPGSPSVRIRLGEQRAYFYKNGELVGLSSISSGREGFGTPLGAFKIKEKDKNHQSSLYGDYVNAKGEVLQKDIDRKKDPMPPGAKFDGAKMPYFMRIVGAVGMHQGFLPGVPDSHGCIRMPKEMAEAFFRNVELGTPVVIEP